MEDKPTGQSLASLPLVHHLNAEPLSTDAPKLGASTLSKVLSPESLTTGAPKVGYKVRGHRLDVPEDEDDSSPKKVRKKYRQEPIQRVLKKRWPNGVPPVSELSNRDYLREVIDAYKNDLEIKMLGVPTPDRKSFLRAAGRIIN